VRGELHSRDYLNRPGAERDLPTPPETRSRSAENSPQQGNIVTVLNPGVGRRPINLDNEVSPEATKVGFVRSQRQSGQRKRGIRQL
jgi:hypothetical protein